MIVGTQGAHGTPFFIVDRVDRTAQRVTDDADDPNPYNDKRNRFIKVCAVDVREAFRLAGVE